MPDEARRSTKAVAAESAPADSGQLSPFSGRIETLFQGILESAPDAIIISDAEGRVMLANQRVQDWFGYSPHELVDRTVEVLVPERFRGIHVSHRAGYYRHPHPRPMGAGFELWGRRKDGSEFPVEISLSPLRVDGSFIVTAIIRDVTERRRFEDEQRLLVEAGSRCAATLDRGETLKALAGVCIPFLADVCTIDLVDDAENREHVAGVSSDVAVAAALRATPPGQPSLLSGLHPVGQALESETAVLSSDPGDLMVHAAGWPAERSLVSVLAVPLQSRGRTFGVLTLGRLHQPHIERDLALSEELARRCGQAIDNALLYSAERRARADAEALAAQRATILRQIADGVLLADSDGRVVFANRAARRMCGITGREPSLAEFFETHVFAGPDGEPLGREVAPLYHAARWGDLVIGAEFRIRRPDSSEVVAEGSAAPIVTDDGQNLGAVLTLHDVTERRELQQQREEFFANASHDLRTPLSAIKTSIGVVLDNEPPGTPSPVHRLLLNIQRSADRMDQLVSDLLELARLETGRTTLELDATDLRSVAEQAVRAIEPLAETRGQQVEMHLPPDPVIARVDAKRFERALLNLLSNAHKYAGDGARIALRLERTAEDAVLAVSDNGPGVPVADQARIFDRFYRSATEETRRRTGTGLGLPIVRALVELHGGRVWLESEPGAGSIFWVAVPLPPAAGASESPPEE